MFPYCLACNTNKVDEGTDLCRVCLMGRLIGEDEAQSTPNIIIGQTVDNLNLVNLILNTRRLFVYYRESFPRSEQTTIDFCRYLRTATTAAFCDSVQLWMIDRIIDDVCR